jgi:mannonate dehydratase
MRIVFGALKEFNDDAMLMAQAMGADGIHFNTPPLARRDENFWSAESLLWLKEYSERFGLRLDMIENVPVRFYDHILTGGPRRDEQIENYIKTVRNMGKAGIPILGHHFCPTWVWRTSVTEPYRGASHVSSFDSSLLGTVPNATKSSALHKLVFPEGKENPTREDLWENFTYFMSAVIPEAEKAGVRLITHPSDPPIEKIAGAERIFISKEDYLKAEKITNSDAWGLNLCVGCFSQLGGEEYVMDMINTFVPRGKVSMVHLRDVQGNIDCFKECFLGDGNFNPAKVLLELKRCGYDGLVMDDHVPFLQGDTRWGHTARAYAHGYIQGLRMMLNYLDN